jgi:hypothetical protein
MNWKAAWVLCVVSACVAGRSNASPVNIAVDIDSVFVLPGTGPTPAAVETQPGFTSWDLTGVGVLGATKTVDGVTFTLFGFSSSFQSRYRNSQLPTDVPGDFLLRDFVFNETQDDCFIGLRISGLDVGAFAMQSWHYDGLHNVLDAGNSNFIQIEVRNQSEPSPPAVVDHFAFSMMPATFQFSVDAPGQVKEIIFREDSLKNATRLNGFKLISVPEPSTILVVTAAAVLLNLLPQRRFKIGSTD